MSMYFPSDFNLAQWRSEPGQDDDTAYTMWDAINDRPFDSVEVRPGFFEVSKRPRRISDENREID
jgi:hypothetical protein